MSVSGDVNCDGRVNVADVTKTIAHIMKDNVIVDDTVLAAANVINDDRILVNDVTRMISNIMNNG